MSPRPLALALLAGTTSAAVVTALTVPAAAAVPAGPAITVHGSSTRPALR